MPQHKAEMIAKEYEDFAYIVSHDLSAPLRHIKQFTHLLLDARKDELSDEEKKYTEFLEKSLQRLDKMQEALLTFSRLSTRPNPKREVDCNQIIDLVLQKLNTHIMQNSVSIEYSKLPTVIADPQQLEMLFYCLIDNALKFHEDDNNLKRIFIGAESRGAKWLFEVRDNGIGIDAKYYHEVFRLFRRLNPEKYDGTGAGLTIAQKIARRHGGEIFIDSQMGRGTSIFFSWPKSSSQ